MAQPALFLIVEVAGVSPWARRGQGGAAGGLIAMASFQVVSQFRVGGKGVGVEPGGGAVHAFEVTNPSPYDPLAWVRGRGFAFEDTWQLPLQLDQAFALPYPQGRGVRPARVLGTQFVAAAQLLQGLPELPLPPQAITQVAVSLRVVLLESDGLAVLGDGLAQLTLGLRV